MLSIPNILWEARYSFDCWHRWKWNVYNGKSAKTLRANICQTLQVSIMALASMRRRTEHGCLCKARSDHKSLCLTSRARCIIAGLKDSNSPLPRCSWKQTSQFLQRIHWLAAVRQRHARFSRVLMTCVPCSRFPSRLCALQPPVAKSQHAQEVAPVGPRCPEGLCSAAQFFGTFLNFVGALSLVRQTICPALPHQSTHFALIARAFVFRLYLPRAEILETS